MDLGLLMNKRETETFVSSGHLPKEMLAAQAHTFHNGQGIVVLSMQLPLFTVVEGGWGVGWKEPGDGVGCFGRRQKTTAPSTETDFCQSFCLQLSQALILSVWVRHVLISVCLSGYLQVFLFVYLSTSLSVCLLITLFTYFLCLFLPSFLSFSYSSSRSFQHQLFSSLPTYRGKLKNKQTNKQKTTP